MSTAVDILHTFNSIDITRTKQCCSSKFLKMIRLLVFHRWCCYADCVYVSILIKYMTTREEEVFVHSLYVYF